MALQPNAPQVTTFTTSYHPDLLKRTVVPELATASLFAAFPPSLLSLAITNENAALSQLSSDILNTPQAAWFTGLPAEVQTYFLSSLSSGVLAPTNAASSLAFTTPTYSIPTYSYSSYSYPSYTYTTPNSYSTSTSYYTTTKKKLSTLAIVWIIIGGLLALGAIGTGILFVCICARRSRRRTREAEQQRQIIEANARANKQNQAPPQQKWEEQHKFAPKVDTAMMPPSPYNGVPELATTYAYPTQIELPNNQAQNVPSNLTSPHPSEATLVSPVMGQAHPARGYELPAQQQRPVELGGQGVVYSELPNSQRYVSEMPGSPPRVVSEMPAVYSPAPGHANLAR